MPATASLANGFISFYGTLSIHSTLRTRRVESFPLRLLVAVGDPAPGKIVRRHLDLHSVAFEDTDVVLPHLSGEVRQHVVVILQLHPECRIRQDLRHSPFDFDCVFRHLVHRFS
jgi:hypothetical protein